MIWGQTIDNQQAYLYVLKNKRQTEVHVTNYGAHITKLLYKKNNKFIDLVLGYDKLQDYEANAPHIGSTVGRTAGRIT